MNIPTAEELLRNKYKLEGDRGVLRIDQVVGFMVEYTKLHRKAILGAAVEQADFTIETYNSMQEGSTVQIEADSILNAYPEDLIK